MVSTPCFILPLFFFQCLRLVCVCFHRGDVSIKLKPNWEIRREQSHERLADRFCFIYARIKFNQCTIIIRTVAPLSSLHYISFMFTNASTHPERNQALLNLCGEPLRAQFGFRLKLTHTAHRFFWCCMLAATLTLFIGSYVNYGGLYI